MGSFFDRYTPLPGRYDELISSQGKVRPHWNDLVGGITSLDQRELGERQSDLRRMLQEHGVTYNVYEGEKTKSQPWPMDLLPMVVESRNWRDIEVGITQRAELLRSLMHDLYGAQNAIKRGWLPAQLIYGHHGYLLPCMQPNLPLENQLIIYAADLGRSPDGNVWVTGDRTQAPSGIGYALAARTVSSRVLPSLFRESNVHPILPFLRDLRSRLIQLAESDSHRVAMLTPGTANETYAEQAYLARHLGFPLLEGSDLEFHKGTCSYVGPEGRQQISVLLRRMDDDFCDPLELNRRSILGAPGLLQAVRNRRLICANPLGSGLLENPALMAFLPRLCRELLGEELKLPSQDTWWCGQAADLQYVQSHFDDMIVRGFRPSVKHPTVSVATLSIAQKQTLLACIKAQPDQFVAQKALAQSCAPVMRRGGVVALPMEMRTFAVSYNGGFRVMSGGFARAGERQNSWRFSGQLGGVTKDIWVLASEQQRASQTLPQFLPRLQRSQQLAQPHVAENLLWLGRYTARADMLVRLLVHAHEHLQEGRPAADGGATQALLEAITWHTTLYPGFIGPVGAANLLRAVPQLFHVQTAPLSGSLRQNLQGMQDTAAPLRDFLVPEAYRLLTQLLGSMPTQADGPANLQALRQTQLMLSALQGLLLRTLSEDNVRSIIEMGLCLEQLLDTVRLLRSFVIDTTCPADAIAPMAHMLTRSPPDFLPETNRSSTSQLLDSLLISERNPQSVRYQLMLLERLLRSVQISQSDSEKLAARIASQLSILGTMDANQLATNTEADSPLAHLLVELDSWLRKTAIRIERRFTPRRALMQRQLVET